MCRWLAGLILFFLTFAYAQSCLPDLQADYTAEALVQPATGWQAAELLRRAVEILEPALPRLYSLPGNFPLTETDEGFETAKFLAERGLISWYWQPEAFDEDTWLDMLKRLADWYNLPTKAGQVDMSLAVLIESLSQLMLDIAQGLQPVALLAVDPSDSSSIAFWAIIRNDSVFPRMIVLKPPTADINLREGPHAVLPHLGNCALIPANYLYAPADTAQNLFLANNQADMYIVATAPEPLERFVLVPRGQETDYLTYQQEAIGEMRQFSVVFSGSSVSPLTIMRLLPQVRTNMNPQQVLTFLRGG